MDFFRSSVKNWLFGFFGNHVNVYLILIKQFQKKRKTLNLNFKYTIILELDSR